MNNFCVRLFTFAALLCGVFFLTNCGGTTTGTNNAPASNTAVVVNKSSEPAKTAEAPKTTEPAGDSVGVAECDDYIKKFEACMTKVAKDAPQAKTGLQTTFDSQRNAYKTAAANPQSKATLATTCKQNMETMKQATSMYKCEW